MKRSIGKEELIFTSVPELCDGSGNALLLGEWCKKNRHFADTNAIQSVNNPWFTVGSTEHKLYVEETVQELLPIVSHCMNEIHGLEKSESYWNILVGRFLRLHTGTLYERYLCLKNALDLYPNVSAVGLAASSFQTHRNLVDFRWARMHNDLTNHQLFTQVASLLDFDMQYRSYDWEPPILEPVIKRTLMRDNVLRPIKQVFRKVFDYVDRGYRGPIAVCYASIPEEILRALTVKSRFKIWSVPHTDELGELDCERDTALRSFFESQSASDAFRTLAIRTLAVNMPFCYIEQFSSLQKIVTAKLRGETFPEVIVMGPVSRPHIQYWIAETVDKGGKLIAVQHGGGYGEIEQYGGEKHERSVSDHFATWGWKDNADKTSNKEIALPALRLTNIPNTKPQGGNNILWVGRPLDSYDSLKYPSNLCPYPVDFFNMADYEEGQRLFCKGVNPKLRSHLTLRLKPTDSRYPRKVNVRRRFQSSFPEIKLDDGNQPLADRMREARMVVVDHFASTSFLEALRVGVPVIVFSHQSAEVFSRLRESARPLYRKMFEVGVFQDNPESAAALVNSVYDRIEEWWYESKRRDVVQEFARAHACMSARPLEEWLEFIRSLARL